MMKPAQNALWLALSGTLACTRSSTPLTGTYTMTRWNYDTLPAPVPYTHVTGTLILHDTLYTTSGTLRLMRSGGYTYVYRDSEAISHRTGTRAFSAGRWCVVNDSLVLTDTASPPLRQSATVAGGILTFFAPGIEFQKQ